MFSSASGLLGTNNGEPSDDWLSPNGKNRTKASDFVNSWLMRGDEECQVKREVEICPYKPDNRCKELFENKTSPLSKCFSKVGCLLCRHFSPSLSVLTTDVKCKP